MQLGLGINRPHVLTHLDGSNSKVLEQFDDSAFDLDFLIQSFASFFS